MKHLGTKLLKTERVILRKFTENDAEEIYFSFINQEEFLYYANKEMKNFDEVKEMLKKIEEKYNEVSYYNWLIVRSMDNKIIGSINLKPNDKNDSVEFNYVIDNRYTNQGYMTETLKKVKEYCFDEMNVNRFQGGCCIENLASKKVMEKCNMKCEGILKSYIKLKDGYHDMYMYSLIK